MAVAACGSYYFFNNMSESHYLTYYAEASRTLDQAETVLASNTKADSLNQSDTSDAQKAIREQKDSLDGMAKKFSNQKAFSGYEQQHQMTMELLQKESSVMERVNLILKNPLDTNTKDTIDGLKTDIQAIKNMENKRERQQGLADFFQSMDKEIADYDNAKTDLGSMMESSRSGSMLWVDYFNIIDNAKKKRTDIKDAVAAITTPDGTESLQKQFIQVLAESIRYCDLMRMSANLQYREYYLDSNVKYEEAKKLNQQVQDDYQAFISSYQSQKNQMVGK